MSNMYEFSGWLLAGLMGGILIGGIILGYGICMTVDTWRELRDKSRPANKPSDLVRTITRF